MKKCSKLSIGLRGVASGSFFPVCDADRKTTKTWVCPIRMFVLFNPWNFLDDSF